MVDSDTIVGIIAVCVSAVSIVVKLLHEFKHKIKCCCFGVDLYDDPETRIEEMEREIHEMHEQLCPKD
jgi:hypothetical protein